jgi:hypothetical protein
MRDVVVAAVVAKLNDAPEDEFWQHADALLTEEEQRALGVLRVKLSLRVDAPTPTQFVADAVCVMAANMLKENNINAINNLCRSVQKEHVAKLINAGFLKILQSALKQWISALGIRYDALFAALFYFVGYDSLDHAGAKVACAVLSGAINANDTVTLAPMFYGVSTCENVDSLRAAGFPQLMLKADSRVSHFFNALFRFM